MFEAIKTYFKKDENNCKGFFNSHDHSVEIISVNFRNTGKFIDGKEIKSKFCFYIFECPKCGHRIVNNYTDWDSKYNTEGEITIKGMSFSDKIDKLIEFQKTNPEEYYKIVNNKKNATE